MAWDQLWMFMPKSPDEDPIIQVASTHFKWRCMQHSPPASCKTNSSFSSGKRAYPAVTCAASTGIRWHHAPTASSCCSHVLDPGACVMMRSTQWDCGPLQVWLQEYAWTEADQRQQIASRNARANTEQEEAALSMQPLFCFETALKLHGEALAGLPCDLYARQA